MLSELHDQEVTSKILCPRCHQSNTQDSEYCFACGMPLGDVQQADDPAFESNSSLQYTPAGFWVRAMALVVDSFILALCLLAIILALMGDLPPYLFTESGYNNLMVLLTVAYHTVFIAACATTGGKRQFRLAVLRTDGSRVGAGRALARSILTGLSATLLGLGYLMVAFRKDKRALHDLICDTVVIRRRGPGT